jgi:2-dehydropantoate 2-reductase
LPFLGPGGVGGLLAGLLARQGEQVICVARESTAGFLNDHGPTIRSVRYRTFAVPAHAVINLVEPVEACFVTVKATSLDKVIERLPGATLGQTLIVPFLNGLEHVALLRSACPVGRIVVATIRVESIRVSPGEIEYASPFALVELAATGDSIRAQHLARTLKRADFNVEIRDDETAMLRERLSFFAPVPCSLPQLRLLWA